MLQENFRFFKAVEREITEPVELQQTVCDLQLELRDVKHSQDQLKQASTALPDHNSTSKAMLAVKMLDLVSDEHIERLNAKVLQLENLRERNQKTTDSLKDTMDAFSPDKQNEKVFRTMSEELRDRDKLTLLESRLEKMKAENEKLLAEVCTLQENEKILIQKNKNLTTEIAHLDSVTEKTHAKNLNLREEIFELEDQVIEAEKDKCAQVKSVEEKLQAEIKRMNLALHNFQEKDDFLLDQNSCLIAELVQVESQRDELKKEILSLREPAQDLEDQWVDAEYEIMKEDEIEKQNRIIGDQQEQINDLNEDRAITRQITQDLKDQPSLLQEENILADVQNLREECETAESEEMGDPVAKLPPNMVQNSGSWSHCAKRLLKVGLSLALTSLLTATGILIPLMYYSCNADTSCSPWDNMYNLLEPYSNFEHTPAPF